MSYIIIKDNAKLKAIGKKFNLDFCTIFKYYTGNAYCDNTGERLPLQFEYRTVIYKLKYFDGCFNPFLIQINKY